MSGRFAYRSLIPHWGMRPACALLVTMMLGCQSVAPTPMSVPPVAVPTAKPTTNVDPELVDQFATWLDQEAWQVDLKWTALTLEPSSPVKSRWLFLPAPKSTAKEAAAAERGAMEPWSAIWRGDANALEPADRQAVTEVLSELRPRGNKTGANATILYARLMREPSDRAELTATLARIAAGQYDNTGDEKNVVKAPTTTRAAAAEVWCDLLRKSSDDPVTALVPAGELLQRPGLPDEVRMTLWRALAVAIPPDHIPQLSSTLNRKWDGTPTGEVLKRAAIDACIIHAVTNAVALTEWDASRWPPYMEAVRYDNDPKLRQLFARWLVLSHHPQAATWLTAQLRDTQPMVRETALHTLGELNDERARDELLKSAQRETGRSRALAVHALSRHSVQDVLKFARDPSADVRAAVARSLVNKASEETAAVLRPCLSDPNAEVAATALVTIQTWPPEWRYPLLLEAVRAGTLATRQTAVFALRDSFPDLPDLSIDGTLDERDQAVRQFAQAHRINLSITVPPRDPVSEPSHTVVMNDTHTAELLETLQQYLNAPPQTALAAEAWDRLLIHTKPIDVAAIERILAEEHAKPTADTVRRELLPRVSPAYAALIDLESREVTHRRRGARALLASAEQAALSPGVLARLRELLTYEQDQLVWQSCLTALQPDALVDTQPIVLLAINQTWPDIRRLGIDVVQQHPAPEAAVWLLPLLADPQRTVRMATIRALAACGNPVAVDGLPATKDAPAIPGLRRTMTDNDEELRLAAIVAAATLHDEQALQELMRLSQHPTPSTRDFAAQAMGRTGQVRFIDTLIRMAWTETADPVKLSILKSLDTLTPVERRPSELTGLVANASIDDKIKVWARWGEAQRRRALTTAPVAEAPFSGEGSSR